MSFCFFVGVKGAGLWLPLLFCIRLFINFLFSVAAVTIFGGPRPKETGNQRISIARKAEAL